MITIINEKSGFSAKSICLTKPDSPLASDGQLVIMSLRKVSRGKTPESGHFSSIQWFSCVRLCATPMDCSTPGYPVTNSQSLHKLMSIESVMPSNHLILCRPLLLPSSILPSIRVISNESALHIR